jgi:Rad3-related DNA helicase
MKIKSIKKIDYKDDVYNLHIKDNHNYFANNHCVSNCHSFDDVISDFISIKINEFIVKKLKFSNESEIIKKIKNISTISQYVEFLNYLQGEIADTISAVESSIGLSKNAKSIKRDIRVTKILGGKNNDLKLMQIITDLQQYQSKIEIFLKEYKANPNNWIFESNYNEKNKQKEISLEPIWAFDYLDKYIFSKYDMVFLMSGTILDKNLFCDLNGLDASKTVYYSVESPFPIENRPIYYMPLGKMSYAKKEETFKNYVPFINKILKKYSDKKGIIHTNSFELASWISREIKDPRLVYHDSSNKDEVLSEHYSTDKPTVIVSPSMDTGVSFDDDKARFQVITKIPYPSLASQKNKLRQKMNPDWYSWRTVSGLIQMTGRVIRSDKDYADTIIIDSSFGDLLKYSGHYFPNWFQDAIKKIEVKKKTI